MLGVRNWIRSRSLAVAGVVVFALTALANSPALTRWFDSADDWLHLERAQQLASGSAGALGLLLGNEGIASIRPVSEFLWLGDFLVWGWNAQGYFLTNVVALALLAALVCWFVGRESNSTAAGALSGSLVGLSVAANQPMVFLAARDDLLAALFAVAALICWRSPGRIRGPVGAGGFLLLSLLSKPVAVLLPLAFLLMRRPGEDGGLRGRALAIAPSLAALAIVGALWVQVSGSPSGLAGHVVRGPWVLSAALVNGAVPHLLSSFSRSGNPWFLLHDLPRVLFVGALAWLVFTGRSKPSWGVAAVLFGSGLLVALPFLGRAQMAGEGGRFLVLGGVGLAVLGGQIVGSHPTPRVRTRLALAGFGAALLGFVGGALPSLASPRSPAQAVWESLNELPAEPDRTVFVAMARPDRGALSLLTSPLLARRLGALPRTFLQGVPRYVVSGHGRGEVLFSAQRFSETDISAGDVVLVDSVGPEGDTHFTVEEPRVLVGGTDLALPFDSQWQLSPDPRGPWDQERREGADQATADVEVWGAWPGLDLWRALASAKGVPVHLGRRLSPIDPSSVCAARIELSLDRERRPPPRVQPLEQFAALMFSDERSPDDPDVGLLVVPYEARPGRQVLEVDLANSPAWRQHSSIQWVGVMPSNQPGTVALHSLNLQGCEAVVSAAPGPRDPDSI